MLSSIKCKLHNSLNTTFTASSKRGFSRELFRTSSSDTDCILTFSLGLSVPTVLPFKFYNTIWYDMIWYDMIWYDMIWNARLEEARGGPDQDRRIILISGHKFSHQTSPNSISNKSKSWLLEVMFRQWRGAVRFISDRPHHDARMILITGHKFRHHL